MEELKPMAPLESLACYCWDKHLEHGLEAYHGSEFDEGADHAYLDIIDVIKKIEEDENAVQKMKNAENAKEILNAFGKSMNLKFEVVK